MTISSEFLEKTFKDDSLQLKEAYLKACKWVAKHILSNEELKNVLVEYVLDKEKCQVVVKLHCTLKSEEERERYCRMCKEFHEKVFVNSFFNCNKCSMISLNKRQVKRLQIKKQYYNEIMERKK